MSESIETSAGGIVYKKEHDYVYWLIIKHTGKGHWGFPKGHVADKVENEKMEDAALREVEEEGGIQAKIINDQPVLNEYFYRQGELLRKKHVYYYLMEYSSGDIQDHDHEITDIKWATEQEVRETVTFKTDLEAFDKLLNVFSI